MKYPRPCSVVGMASLVLLLIGPGYVSANQDDDGPGLVQTTISTGLPALDEELEVLEALPETWQPSAAIDDEMLAKDIEAKVETLGKNAKKFRGALKLGKVVSAIQVGESGGTLAGRLIEGDISGAAAHMADDQVKGLTVSGGAALGAKMMAAAGTAVGGPIGGLAGGAVGAVGGAMMTSMGYDSVIGDTVKQYVEKKLQFQADPLAMAKWNRLNHLAGQEALQAHEAIGFENQWDEEVVVTDSPFSNLLAAEKTRDSSPSTDGGPAGASIPVIPTDCRLEITTWNPELPKPIRFASIFVVKDGKATSKKSSKPAMGVKWIHNTWKFDGTIEANKLDGTNVNHYAFKTANGNLVTTVEGRARGRMVLTLHMDGKVTGHVRYRNHSKTSMVYTDGSGENRTINHPATEDTTELAGTWKLSK